MTIEDAIRDYEGSFLLGEADCEHWISRAHPKEIRALAMLVPEDIGKTDAADQKWVSWLVKKAEQYRLRDPRFHRVAYFDGFLRATRRERKRRAFAAATASASTKQLR